MTADNDPTSAVLATIRRVYGAPSDRALCRRFAAAFPNDPHRTPALVRHERQIADLWRDVGGES